MRLELPDGFRAWCVALALWCGAMAHAAEQHPLMGATREEVLSRYGEPRSTLVAGNRELLFYPRERLVLRDGLVVEVERIASESAKRPTAPPTPAPEPTPPATATTDSSSARPTPGNDAAPARPAAPTETDVPPATPAETEPAEPKLEIKRVLPPGSSATRPAPKQPVSAPRTTPSTTPVTGAAKAPTTPIPSAGPAPAPSTETPLAPVTTQSSPAGSSSTNAAQPTPAAQATATEPAETNAAETTDAAKKGPSKKEVDLKAARRRLEQAEAEAVDPTAAVFTTRTYAIALLIIGGGIGYLIWRRRQRQLELEATAVSRTPFNAPVVMGGGGTMFNAELLSKLEWKRFEELVASYYSKTGVVAMRTKNGPAAPVHIKISWKGEPRPFALVQCIAQPQGLIDAKPLQELQTVLAAEDIRRGYVVTMGKFNVAARDFAEEKHITLLSGDIFLEKLNALPDAARLELMQEVTAGDYTTPSCPKCEAKMTRSPDEPSQWRCAAHPEQQIAGRR